MIDIENVAETMTAEFARTVKAVQKERRLQIDSILTAIGEAEQERTASLAEVRRMQEEAAKIVAESIRLAEKAENEFRDKMRVALVELHDMRGPSPISSRANMRAIAGKQGQA